MKPQTLSKTRFKLALECPTKVYYSLDERYANQMQEDEILEALAEGGHQIGALAKLMHPEGVEVKPDTVEVGMVENVPALLCERIAYPQKLAAH